MCPTDDHGLEVLKKSGEEVIPGSKADYYIKVGPTPGHPLQFSFALPTTPNIYNVTSPVTPNTEFSLALSGAVQKLLIKAKNNADIELSFSSGGTTLTIPKGSSYSVDFISLTGATLYLKTSLGSSPLQVLTWT